MRAFQCSEEITTRTSTKKHRSSTSSGVKAVSDFSATITSKPNLVPEYVSQLFAWCNVYFLINAIPYTSPSSTTNLSESPAPPIRFLSPKLDISLYNIDLLFVFVTGHPPVFLPPLIRPQKTASLTPPFLESKRRINIFLRQLSTVTMAPKRELGETKDSPPAKRTRSSAQGPPTAPTASTTNLPDLTQPLPSQLPIPSQVTAPTSPLPLSVPLYQSAPQINLSQSVEPGPSLVNIANVSSSLTSQTDSSQGMYYCVL